MIKNLFLALLFLMFGLGPLCAAEQPNFVWLVSEDNSKHYLKLFDEHGAETPRIAELAADGLIFNHAFSNAPVCSVARTTLITGCYAPRIGTQYHRKSVPAPMPKGLRMFPAYLRDAGYYTTNNSKKDYNAIEGKGVWDESSKKATWRDRKDGQPFFHFQSFGASHESSLHFSREQMAKQKTTTDPARVFIHPYHPDTPTFRYTVARYHDRIAEIDRQIGAVVDKLADDGLLEDTFIFYFGDHGGVLPRSKGYAYETGLHIPLVVRVPKNFAHLAPAKRGARVDGFVSFVDFGPTLLHLAGVEVPEQVDGEAFLGEGVTLDALNKRDEAFGYADRFDEKYDLVRTLRKGRYKYVRNYTPFNFDGLQNNYRYRMLAYQEWRKLYHEGELNDVQSAFFEPRQVEALYDLEADPYETKNLANNPRFAKRLVEMRVLLRSRILDMPDLSLVPENIFVKEFIPDPAGRGPLFEDQLLHLRTITEYAHRDFDERKAMLEDVLQSKIAGRRYWGLVVCSCFGEQARDFVPAIKKIAEADSDRLTRVRAAEFLALIGEVDPQPVIMKALAETGDGIEAGIILNTVVLLRDGKPGYKFDIDLDDLKPSARKNDVVKRRIQYLNGK